MTRITALILTVLMPYGCDSSSNSSPASDVGVSADGQATQLDGGQESREDVEDMRVEQTADMAAGGAGGVAGVQHVVGEQHHVDVLVVRVGHEHVLVVRERGVHAELLLGQLELPRLEQQRVGLLLGGRERRLGRALVGRDLERRLRLELLHLRLRVRLELRELLVVDVGRRGCADG